MTLPPPAPRRLDPVRLAYQRDRRRGLLILAVSLLLALPYFLWWVMPIRPLRVVIIDRTVSDRTYREHQGLVWLLNHYRFLRPDGRTWDVTRDYVGFHPDQPGRSYSVSNFPADYPPPDVVYWADTYGVYSAEWYLKSIRGERSKLIHGGVLQSSVDYAKRAIEAGGTSVFAEFNTLGAPTEQGPRQGLEQLLSIEWTGWTARWFDDLGGDEIPEWLKEDWKHSTGGVWSWKGGGFVFCHEDGRLVVLQAGTQVGPERNRLDFADDEVPQLGVTDSVPYLYWFDVVRPTGHAQVRAQYLLDLTDAGRHTLDSAGIGTSFPAMIRGPGALEPTWYFAGDWVDTPNAPHVFRYVGLAWLYRHWPRAADDPQAFFWKVYVPLMESRLSVRADRALVERDLMEGATDSMRERLRDSLDRALADSVQSAGVVR